MKNFETWGLRIRRDVEKNYYSIWNNLVTTRLDMGEPVPLEPGCSEFYDVAINSRCNAGCQFCYVSAGPAGKDYSGICESWQRFIDTLPPDTSDGWRTDEVLRDILSEPESGITPEELELKLKTLVSLKRYGVTYTHRPTQVACGSTGEPTIHPDFPKFLQTVFETRVVPNYTTNGIVLASETKEAAELLEATSNFCGGVAVSFGNKALRGAARKAIDRLASEGECKIMIHELIGSKSDVDELMGLDKEYHDRIHYHVLLPLMAHGRSKEAMDTETYRYLIKKVNQAGMTNLAFGANFLPFFEENTDCQPRVWEYPRHHYSHNMLLQDGSIVITPSSYDLNPIMEIRSGGPMKPL